MGTSHSHQQQSMQQRKNRHPRSDAGEEKRLRLRLQALELSQTEHKEEIKRKDLELEAAKEREQGLKQQLSDAEQRRTNVFNECSQHCASTDPAPVSASEKSTLEKYIAKVLNKTLSTGDIIQLLTDVARERVTGDVKSCYIESTASRMEKELSTVAADKPTEDIRALVQEQLEKAVARIERKMQQRHVTFDLPANEPEQHRGRRFQRSKGEAPIPRPFIVPLARSSQSSQSKIRGARQDGVHPRNRVVVSSKGGTSMHASHRKSANPKKGSTNRQATTSTSDLHIVAGGPMSKAHVARKSTNHTKKRPR